MIALAGLAALVIPMAVLAALLLVVEARQRRRDAVVARQIAVTDAIHAELGAIVAPFVRRRRGGWRVELPMLAEQPGAVQVVAIAARVLGAARPVEVAIVPPAGTRPAQKRPRTAATMSSWVGMVARSRPSL